MNNKNDMEKLIAELKELLTYPTDFLGDGNVSIPATKIREIYNRYKDVPMNSNGRIKCPACGFKGEMQCPSCGEYIPNPAPSAPEQNRQRTAADMAEPLGVVVDEAVKHGKIGREILINPTHEINLPVGTKVYLHPEGNDTVCDMCEVLTKLDELSAPEQEPLAVLADRKGCWLNINRHNFWCTTVGFKKDGQSSYFENSNLKRSENEARAYLSGLPDTNKQGEVK